MSYFQHLVSVLQEQFHATLSRSDVLKPLVWITGMLLLATVGMVLAGAPGWFVKLMASFLTLSVLMYLGTYLYCLFKDPDALRSENYSLHKMAIERGLIGDDISGILDVGDEPQPSQIEQSAMVSKTGDDQ